MNIFLFIDSKQEDLNKELIEFCKNKFQILNIFDDKNKYNNTKFDDKIDFSVSFLNPYIIKDDNIINKNCINFHPSTTKYRGVCGSSLALYYNDKIFGATAHYIDLKIDNGKIISTSNFNIYKNMNCIDLSIKSKLESLKLAKTILNNIYLTNKLPEVNSQLKWGDILMTRKKFNEWLHIDINDIELQKKIRASKNDFFPGPFIRINNKIYSLKEINN